jgi:hypothetical protein
MPVSARRESSAPVSSLAPVVRTTSAVAAAVVDSARSPAHGSGHEPDEDRQAERERVEPEQAAEREGDQHADHRGADLLRAAAERPVDGRMHGQQRGPGGEEGLLDVEHVDREHPRDDRGYGRLDDLQRVRPPGGVAQASGHG